MPIQEDRFKFGKDVIQRFVRTMLSVCFFTLLFYPYLVNAHGSWELHYNDCARVLNGFGVPDGREAKSASETVANSSWSANATESTKQADRAAGGFYDLFDQVSNKMDSMPHDLETRFGLKPRALSNPKVHRVICHGWPLDKDPPKFVLDILERKYGIPRAEFLKYWHEYQKTVFEMSQSYTKLPLKQAKAFASLIWDVHLLGDLGPDNSEVKWVMKLDSVVDDLCRNLETLLGENSESAKRLCKHIRDFVAKCRAEGLSASEIATRLIDELCDSKIGSRIFAKYKELMKRIWNVDIATTVNAAEASRRSAKKVKEEGERRAAKRKALSQKAEAKNKSVNSTEAQERTAKTVARECDKAKVSKTGEVQERKGKTISSPADEGAVKLEAQKSGLLKKYPRVKNPVVVKGIMKSVVSKTGSKGVCCLVSAESLKGAIPGAAAEGVLALVFSQGFATYKYLDNGLTSNEFEYETAKNVAASASVGGSAYVAILLGASPGGPVVMAISIGGFIITEIAFKMGTPEGFSVEDIIGFSDDMLNVRGAMDIDGADSALDLQGLPSALDFEGKPSVFDHDGDASVFD